MIESSRDSGQLQVAPAEERVDPSYFTARLSAGTLSASVRFYEPRGFLLGLGEFFRDLAEHWVGWPGEKSWESVEGDLSLTASHDRLGHVTLVVELRERFDPPEREWVARAPLTLEAGVLHKLANAAERFEHANLPD